MAEKPLTEIDLIGDVDLIGNAFDVDGDDDEPTEKTKKSPVRYDPRLVRKILRGVGKGTPLRVILSADGMPTVKTFYDWLELHGLRAKYDELRVRPMPIDDELADEIIFRIANGETFRDIKNSNPDMPDRLRFKDWLKQHPAQYERYHTALALRAEGSVDEMEAIADNVGNDFTTDKNGNPVVNTEAIQRSKLRVEVRKWVAGKFNAKFQDRTTTELVGAEGAPLIPQTDDLTIARKVAFLLAQGVASV